MKELPVEIVASEQATADQRLEREKCLQIILKSETRKKIIVAGPGTGKTYTFQKVLETKAGGNNLVMTFIRKLSDDMDLSFGHLAEVKTFHAYCKKILHQQNGRVNLFPHLTQLISRDAEILKLSLSDFDAKFQTLEETSPEIPFYLRRGDYYESVSFNDSVYRLYKQLKEKADILPKFDQILIDEYQDFNALEVAFLSELEKKGPILIVGDDDQAIYDRRFASPDFLRAKFNAGQYEKFELPFCSRCTEVIVNAAKSIIKAAEDIGNFAGRLQKPFECYLPEKAADSKKFPSIRTVRCSNAQTVSNYVGKAISKIDQDDLSQSWADGQEYPTVLIVGPKQYLAKIQSDLINDYPHLKYAKPAETEYGVVEGYKELSRSLDSNLGWRILAEFFLNNKDFTAIMKSSVEEVGMTRLLKAEFLQRHRRVVEIIQVLSMEEKLSEQLRIELTDLVEDWSTEIIHAFSGTKKQEPEIDKSKPSILLTSFQGCKGLSAGHVFIVGANNSSMPTDPAKIEDIEISQFVVALTRTRKQCHIVSNKWLYSPKDANGNWIPQMERTIFLEFMSKELVSDLGDLKSKAVEAL